MHFSGALCQMSLVINLLSKTFCCKKGTSLMHRDSKLYLVTSTFQYFLDLHVKKLSQWSEGAYGMIWKLYPLVQVNLFQKLATSAEHVVCQKCFECQFVYTTYPASILSLQFSWSMNNLLSYCVLVAAKIWVSDKDLPLLT